MTKFRDILIVTALYLAANVLMLFNNGLYWDDWTIYNTEPDTVNELFRQVGIAILGPIHNFLLAHFGIWIYRLITFLCFLTAAWCLNGILKTINEISNSSRLWIVCLFALFPVNSARIAIITLPYSVSFGLFFFGWWLTARYLVRRDIYLRVLALATFFCSFITNSLIVYYVIVLLYILYWHRERVKSLRTFFSTVLEYADFIINPIVFWLLKFIFCQPYGFSAGYNKVTFSSLIAGLAQEKIEFTFVSSIYEAVRYPFVQYPLIIVVLTALVLYLKRTSLRQGEDDLQKGGWLLLFGVVAFAAGFFPYLAVDRTDVYLALNDWNSRHQLLVPLGAAFIIHYAFYHQNFTVRLAFNTAIVISSVLASFSNYAAYQGDWYKQLAILQELRHNDHIRQATSIYLEDDAVYLNAMQRPYRVFYEYSGMLKLAYGSETRMAIPPGSDLSNMQSAHIANFMNHRYLFNLKDYVVSKPTVSVSIVGGQVPLTVTNVLYMRYCQSFAPDKFNEMLAGVVSLKVKPE